ncbi:hypothetical protein GIB67_008996 [Kingdonia uniflora]|uniref:Transmembrane protein n=1 Tax=Kingdonia uniflora TaxID=39325 RepID=A0A7J7LW05_9MAGN|nr:hypothetical protein GIB67_008996 [Kingdonia uniflora]
MAMEGVKQGLRSLAKESANNSSKRPSFLDSDFGSNQSTAVVVRRSNSFPSLSSSKLILSGSPRSTIMVCLPYYGCGRDRQQMVSVWTCSKICAVGFFVGVVVGFTLKRRVRRWASKLLKRLKDD